MYVVAAVAIVVLAIVAYRYFQQGKKAQHDIPGLSPRSEKGGNLDDIASAGSLHEFLVWLHKKFGPIASFWFGQTYVVSINDARSFKDQINVFDRPPVLFKLFEPFIGPKSIQYANGEDGKARRNLYDRCLTYGAVKKYFGIFQQLSDDSVKALEGYQKNEHVPINKHMMEFTLKADLIALLGSHIDEKIINRFRTLYSQTWDELELRLKSPPTPEREESFKKAKDEIMSVVRTMIEKRKKLPTEHGDEYLLDLIMDLTSDEEQHFCDVITFIVGGFHTSGFLLTWAFYYLASNTDIQEKVYTEIKQVLGDDDIDFSSMNDLHYLRQVQDETMRCSILAPWAARFQHEDSQICGYAIPAETPVIHALGAACVNEDVWSEPYKFDPDRFSPENVSARPHLAFSIFGFAGKRVCPGQRFAYAEASVAMVTVLRKFKVEMVGGQKIEQVHGLITHPSDEIWVTLTPR